FWGPGQHHRAGGAVWSRARGAGATTRWMASTVANSAVARVHRRPCLAVRADRRHLVGRVVSGTGPAIRVVDFHDRSRKLELELTDQDRFYVEPIATPIEPP